MKHSSGSLLQGSPILFGTVMGGIGKYAVITGS